MWERREMLASRREEESTFPLGKDNKDPYDELVDCEYPETALEQSLPCWTRSVWRSSFSHHAYYLLYCAPPSLADIISAKSNTVSLLRPDVMTPSEVPL